MVMSNGDNLTGVTNSAPTGISNARDREYATYGSIAGCNGHRMAYYDSSIVSENLQPYNYNADRDFMEIIVQGAAASVAVL